MIPNRKPAVETTYVLCRLYLQNTSQWRNAGRCVPKRSLRKTFRRCVLIRVKSLANNFTTHNRGDFALGRHSPAERIAAHETLWLSHPCKARRDCRIQAVSRRCMARDTRHDSE